MAFKAVITGTLATFVALAYFLAATSLGVIASVVFASLSGQVVFGLTIAKLLLCEARRERLASKGQSHSALEPSFVR